MYYVCYLFQSHSPPANRKLFFLFIQPHWQTASPKQGMSACGAVPCYSGLAKGIQKTFRGQLTLPESTIPKTGLSMLAHRISPSLQRLVQGHLGATTVGISSSLCQFHPRYYSLFLRAREVGRALLPLCLLINPSYINFEYVKSFPHKHIKEQK